MPIPPSQSFSPLTFPAQQLFANSKAFFSAMSQAVSGTVVVALTALFLTWLRDLSAAARRARFLDYVTKSVEFWSKALQALSEIRQTTQAERDMAEEEIRRCILLAQRGIEARRASTEWTVVEFLNYRQGIAVWRRAMMLYREPSKAARLLRFWGLLLASQPALWSLLISRSSNSSAGSVIFLGSLFTSICLIAVRFSFQFLETLYTVQLRSLETARNFVHTIQLKDA
jgi:hypothetical protein